MRTADVVVVGAGAIGAAAAYELASRGAHVALIDRDPPGAGCSYGNAGLICPSHAAALPSPAAIRDGLGWLARRDAPFALRPRLGLLPWLARFGAASLPARSAAASAALRGLARASLELHARLAASGLPTTFARRGILSVFETQRAFAAARAAAGDETEVLTAEGARAFEPALADDLAGALFHRHEAHCDPGAFVNALVDAARELGAEIGSGVEVLRLRRTNGRVDGLDTTDGPLRAGTVVLAAGTWSRELAHGIGLHVPLEGAKGYHVELRPPAPGAGIPVYMEEARIVATPLGDRMRIAGTLELDGLDLRVDPARVAALTAAARRVLGLVREAPTVHVWRGLRPCAPDGLPVLGRARGVENLVLATGHAMLGVTLAPVTAEIVADLIESAEPAYDLEPFAPSRFHRARELVGR